ncbi:hypothetical protein [Magnetospirillum sp. LM-5]|uniref:hypothetical protein n=1 Tax=Magnetospirillum sp. LM-5 TaxID=2681466 RepID=UPI001570CA2B|nr:hypothetical protein [Magnetospirillum sp. LM-5]
MGGWTRILALTGSAVMMAGVALADDVPAKLDAARAAYAKGDVARAARELEAVLTGLHQRLGKALAETLPAAMAGWQAEAPEIQGLSQAGGGLSVSRAYAKGDSSLNATLILDSPAVDAAIGLFANPAARAGTRKVKVGPEDALLRYDSSTHAGEVTLVIGNRVLLEIEGDGITNGETLVDAAKGWNTARIRTLVGL